jgi:hypothetical protein
LFFFLGVFLFSFCLFVAAFVLLFVWSEAAAGCRVVRSMGFLFYFILAGWL